MFKKLILTMLAVMVTTPAYASEDHKYTEVDAKTLQSMMTDNKDLVVIDSRGGKWYDGVMIDGALHLAVTETTPESLAKIIATKDTPVAFYCVDPACPASAHAIMKAIDAGYTNLYKYNAGIKDWVELGLPTKKDEMYKAEEEHMDSKEEMHSEEEHMDSKEDAKH